MSGTVRILVLGTSGYMGGHVVRVLRDVHGVRAVLGGRSPGASLHVDLATADPAQLAAPLRAIGPDVVVNCAGVVGGSAATLASVNARGPAVLCEALRRAAPTARLVHLGSAAEYGANEAREPVREDAPAAPLSMYGATKLAGTLAVTGSGLEAVVLRVFNPVGPGAPGESLPGRLAGALRRGLALGGGPQEPGNVVQVGDLSSYRDFVDVRDVAEAAALAALGRTGTATRVPPVLNIGSGTVRPVREVADGLVRASGYTGRVLERGEGSARSAAVSWQCADITAARMALGWAPVHGLQRSLADLWEADTARVPVEAAR